MEISLLFLQTDNFSSVALVPLCHNSAQSNLACVILDRQSHHTTVSQRVL